MGQAIYYYTKNYLWAWFPVLPSYQAFCRRLNRIARAFRALSEIWLEEVLVRAENSHWFAVGSCPIMQARRSNSTKAKIGKPLCGKCYNAARKEWYYGVKLHACFLFAFISVLLLIRTIEGRTHRSAPTGQIPRTGRSPNVAPTPETPPGGATAAATSIALLERFVKPAFFTGVSKKRVKRSQK